MTLQEVLLGFACALVAGLGFAVALHLSETLRRAFYPLLVASQTVPIIVIAPILVVWFGYGIGPKLAIIALICFFPITVNTLDGLRSVDPEATKMMRTLDASRGQILRRVEAPTALPYVFSGAKIAVAVAVIGAVFGEWAGADSGPRPPDAPGQRPAGDGARSSPRSSCSRRSRSRSSAFSPSQSAASSLGDRKQGMKRSRIPAIAARRRPARARRSASPPAARRARTSSGETQPLSLTLDFYPNPDHAGIYMAQKLGYFEDAGLDVSDPRPPPTPRRRSSWSPPGRPTWRSPTSPRCCWPTSRASTCSPSAPSSTGPLTSMIWLKKSGIKGIGDLRGKTIATAGIPYQDAYLKTILARAKLSPADVKAVNVGFGLLPAILGGRAQAMLGGFSNVEGVDLRLRGEDPVVTPVDKLGVPTYDELVLVAQRERLEEDPQAIRLFIAALARGTAAAAKNPKAATKALLEANPDLDPKLTEAEVAATLPLLEPSRRRPALRLHGPGAVERVHRLDARQRADRRRCRRPAACSATPTCRATIPE